MPRYCSASPAARSPRLLSPAPTVGTLNPSGPVVARAQGRAAAATPIVRSAPAGSSPRRCVEVEAQTGHADGAPGDDRRLQHDEVAGASERDEGVRLACVGDAVDRQTDHARTLETLGRDDDRRRADAAGEQRDVADHDALAPIAGAPDPQHRAALGVARRARVEAREQPTTGEAQLDGADTRRRGRRHRERHEARERRDGKRQTGSAHRPRVRDLAPCSLKIGFEKRSVSTGVRRRRSSTRSPAASRP